MLPVLFSSHYLSQRRPLSFQELVSRVSSKALQVFSVSQPHAS